MLTNRHHRHHRRGFAMAIVVMLVAVSGVVLAYMLDRQNAQNLSVARQMDAYVFHHISRGLQEAAEAWVRSNGTEPIGTALDEQGMAFTLKVDGGQEVNIYFFDAQDTVLTDFAGLAGDNLNTALDIVEQLRRDEGPNAGRYIRKEGPVAVCVNSAPPPVLRAVIGSILDPLQTDSLVREIRTARDEGEIDTQGLEAAFRAAETPSASIPKLQGLLVPQPVLWRIIAEAATNEMVWPRPPAIRYGGLALVTNTTRANTKSGAIQRSSAILSWENLTGTQERSGRNHYDDR